MNKKPPVKPVKPVKSPVVSPPAPPAPPAPVWQRLELPTDCSEFETNQLANHAGATVITFDSNEVIIKKINYGLGYINIIPPVGNWVEQASTDGGRTYRSTGVSIKQIQAGANNTTSVNLTLDGGAGPAKLMRYLLNQESL